MSAQDIISSLQLALVILSGWDANPQQQQVWPVRFASKDNEILLYEPHAEKLIEDRLSLRAAFALYQEGTKDPAFGVCWMDTRIVSDRESRQARLTDLVLTQIRFPAGSDTATGTANRALVAELLEERTLDVSLDELLTTLEQDGIQDTGLKTDPPEIIFRTHPTVLILLDGEARKMPVGEYGCQRIVNTPNLLLTDPEGSRYFLYGNDTWYESRSLDGNWTVSQKLPKAVRKTASAFEALPSGSLAPAAEDLSENFDRVGSDIILRTSPAELLLTDGAPDWRSVPETRLLYATNSQDHLFQYIPEQRYYVLISGRWFVSLALEQGWEYRAPDLLPEDFKRIPEDHPKAAVLPHVAGTAAAIEAVNDSRIPQTAVIERKTATCTVTFDGEPVFKPIEGTRMQYAINASEPVIRIDSNFYACENGVWYWGPAASGPWQAATAVPSEVKEIPPSCPLFPVRYVSIYGYTDDYIFTGYTPGYLGCYVFGPTVVFGTGWYYPGWWHRQYYPHPFTYGFNMHYDPWWGWTCGYSWAYGGTDAWLLWYWSPYPTIGWYHGWWGPYYRPPVYYHSAGDFHYGPRSRSMREVGPRSSYNLYRQGTNRISKDPGTVRRGITRNQAPRNVPNNVFAAPDGDVIRKSGSDWEKNNGRTWEKVPARPDVTPTRPAIPVNTPDRLEWQRNRSEQRNRIFQQTKPSGFPVPDMRSGGRPSKSIIVAPRK